MNRDACGSHPGKAGVAKVMPAKMLVGCSAVLSVWAGRGLPCEWRFAIRAEDLASLGLLVRASDSPGVWLA